MLRLYLAEKEARLSADTEITLKLTNEWFKDRETEHSFPFTLKLEANRHIFGFPERPGNHALSRYMALHGKTYSIVMPAFITYGGVTLLYGKARITSVNETEVELFCYSGEYNFWSELSLYRFGELSEGVRELFNIVVSNNGSTMDKSQLLAKLNEYRVSSGVLDKIMAFPALYDPTMSSIPGESAAILPYWLNFRNNDGLLLESDGKHCILLPCVNMGKLMELILAILGYSVKFSSLKSSPVFPYTYIISRRKYVSLAHYTPSDSYTLQLTDFLPNITFKEFLEEIERRFCVLIQPRQPLYSRDSNKIVNIVSFDSYITALPLEIEVLDGCEKSVLESDDFVAGYRFSDPEQGDDALTGQVQDVEPITLSADMSNEILHDDTDGIKSIECISTPLARFFPDVDSSYAGHGVISSGDTGNIDIDNEEEYSAGYIVSRDKEFRIALSKGGNSLKPEFNEEESLEWDQLREGYRSKFDFINGQFMTVEFTLEQPVMMIHQINNLFFRPIVVRNLRYLVVEQNISFKGSNIEYRIKCYPMP